MPRFHRNALPDDINGIVGDAGTLNGKTASEFANKVKKTSLPIIASKNCVVTTTQGLDLANDTTGRVGKFVAAKPGDIVYTGSLGATTSLTDNCSTVTGWTMAPNSTWTSNGTYIYPTAWASGSGWRVSAGTKSFGFDTTDFELEVDLSFINSTSAMGNIEIYVLDASDIELCRWSISDSWAGSYLSQSSVYMNSTTVYNSGSGTAWNAFSGIIKIAREGSTWTVYKNGVSFYSGTGPETEASKVKIDLQHYNGYTVADMRINNLSVLAPSQTVDETVTAIPYMTSNTAPSGIASANAEYHPAWQAFTEVGSTWGCSGTSGWLAYQFTEPKTIYKYSVKGYGDPNFLTVNPRNWTFEGWNGSTWEVLDTRTGYTSWTAHEVKEFTIASPATYGKYRINISQNNGYSYTYVTRLQMFNRSVSGGGGSQTELQIATPAMTGYTAPYGIVTCSSERTSSHVGWYAFDRNIDSTWGSTTSSGWIAYEFSSAKTIQKYTITGYGDGSSGGVFLQVNPKNWTFEGWNGSSWVVLDTRSNQTGWTVSETREYTVSNPTPYIKYRLNISANNGYAYVYVNELQMYEEVDISPEAVDVIIIG